MTTDLLIHVCNTNFSLFLSFFKANYYLKVKYDTGPIPADKANVSILEHKLFSFVATADATGKDSANLIHFLILGK